MTRFVDSIYEVMSFAMCFAKYFNAFDMVERHGCGQFNIEITDMQAYLKLFVSLIKKKNMDVFFFCVGNKMINTK